jgi:hypothetical protein
VTSEYGNTSLIRTLRERFSLGPPLTGLDAIAADIAPILSRSTPRAQEEWPEVLLAVGRWDIHGKAESFHQGARIAFVPRGREDDRRLARADELLQFGRHAERVEHQQLVAVL